MQKPPGSLIPDDLADLLREHRDCHAPVYPPLGNADHGPMTYMALHALGASMDAVRRFARSYREKLAPLPALDKSLTIGSWSREIGRFESYPALLSYFDAEIVALGWRATVDRYLPRLISGATRGAFHPLIRLAYGIDFEFPPEIAAGLAFLACSGTDEQLERAGTREPAPLGGAAYLKSWREYRDDSFSTGRFDDRCDRIVRAVPLRPGAATPCGDFAELSRACLEIFHASQDFFALHLITGSTAFRICAPWLGDDAERLLSVALATAYLAIGAPDFQPVQGEAGELNLRALEHATDEHDIKLMHACRAQARAYEDSDYEFMAIRYLAPRLGASARISFGASSAMAVCRDAA
jgi:hypothetical protein